MTCVKPGFFPFTKHKSAPGALPVSFSQAYRRQRKVKTENFPSRGLSLLDHCWHYTGGTGWGSEPMSLLLRLRHKEAFDPQSKGFLSSFQATQEHYRKRADDYLLSCGLCNHVPSVCLCLVRICSPDWCSCCLCLVFPK